EPDEPPDVPPPDDTPPLAPPTFLRNWLMLKFGSGFRPRGTATSLCPRTREVDRPNSLMSALHSFAYSLIWWAGHESSPVASASIPIACEIGRASCRERVCVVVCEGGGT